MKKKFYLIITILISMFIFNSKALAYDTNSASSVNSASVITILDENYEYTQSLEKLCDEDVNPKVIASFRLVGIFVTIIKIVVPIILIVLGMFDMSKAVLEGKEDSLKKQLISLLKRAIACLLIFFAPSVILGLFHFVDGWDDAKSDYETCLNCLLGDDSCPNVGFGATTK